MCLKVSPSEDNKEQERMCQAIWRGGDGQEVGKSSVHQLLFTARIHAIETEPREYLERLAMASRGSATVQRSAESQQSGKSSCTKDFMKKPPGSQRRKLVSRCWKESELGHHRCETSSRVEKSPSSSFRSSCSPLTLHQPVKVWKQQAVFNPTPACLKH